MITGEMKNKMDSIWDTIWTGGITSPITVLHQPNETPMERMKLFGLTDL